MEREYLLMGQRRMNKLIFILLFLVSLSCSGQNFFWSHTGATEPTPCTEGYGLLYNWYATTDARKISSDDDFIVPTNSIFEDLLNYIDTYDSEGDYWHLAGGKLKETGFDRWDSPNDGATNEYGFNAVGSGKRVYSGDFQDIKYETYIWANTEIDSLYANIIYLNNYEPICYGGNIDKANGNPIRLCNPTTTNPDGFVGTYTQNNGQVIPTIVINGVEWTMNLSETKYRNGDIIPFHGADNGNNFTNDEWAALTTAGVCAYDNNLENVGCDFEFPTE